jgi:hypothetical protein
MKLFKSSLIIGIFLFASCSHHTQLSEKEKDQVKNEIQQFMKDMDAAVLSVNEKAYINMFIQTDELAVASQNNLFPSFDAVRDTIHAHLSVMQKQNIQTNDEKILVIDKDNAVITTSKKTEVSFKNGAEIEMPYVVTILLVKRNAEWKIAHYNN